MRALCRLPLPLAMATALALAFTAHAAVPSTSPRLMARCTMLYGLWFRYEQHPTYHHTGQRAQAELALYRCQSGEYDEAIPVLERMLKRGRILLPPA